MRAPDGRARRAAAPAARALLAAAATCASASFLSAFRWVEAALAERRPDSEPLERVDGSRAADRGAATLAAIGAAAVMHSWAALCNRAADGDLAPASQTVARCFRAPFDTLGDAPLFADAPGDASQTATADDRTALVLATRFAIVLYMDAVEQQLLRLGPALTDWQPEQLARSGQPIQDPLGALFAAVLAVRWLRPKAEAIAPAADLTAPRCERSSLTFRCRRRVAAAVAIMHKYLVNAPPPDGSRAARTMIERVLTADERQRWGVNLPTVVQRQAELEAELLTQLPVFALHAENPLTAAECELSRLCSARVLDDDAVILLRSAAFFFLGACLLDPEADVLERMSGWVSTYTIGRGLVTALLTCARASATPASEYRARYPEGGTARLHLPRGRARPHAAQLRAGAYAAPPCDAADGEHDAVAPVRRLVAPETLETAWRVFQEARACYS